MPNMTLDNITGYYTCRECGQPVFDFVAVQTGGMCTECFVSGEGMGRVREFEVIVRATRHKVDVGGRSDGAKKPRKKTPTPQTRERLQKMNNARHRAQFRLTHFFPEMYDLLFTEELHKEGLVPKPRPKRDHLVKAVATFDRWAAYAADADRSE